MRKGDSQRRCFSRFKYRSTHDDGWTLIELIVAMALMALLSSMLFVQHRNSIRQAKEATLEKQLYIMREAIDQYIADKGRHPDSLRALVSEQYMRAIPLDPFTNSADTWTTIATDPEPTGASTPTGISDVHSGADGIAMNGVPLANK